MPVASVLRPLGDRTRSLSLSLSLSRELSPASVTSCAWAGAFFKFKLVRRPPAAGAPPPPGETCSLSSIGIYFVYFMSHPGG